MQNPLLPAIPSSPTGEIAQPFSDSVPGPVYLKDYSDMSSAEFKAMLRQSDDPIMTLHSLKEEMQERFEQTSHIVNVLSGRGDIASVYEAVTERAHAPELAAARKVQKQAVVQAHLSDHEPTRLQAAEQQIDREYDRERSFSRFYADASTSTVATVHATPADLLRGDVKYFHGQGPVSDKDEVDFAMRQLDQSLDAYDKSPARKRPVHLEAAFTHAYNVFFRLKSLDTVISENPDVAKMVQNLGQAIQGFKRLLATDVQTPEDLSQELRDILQGTVAGLDSTKALPPERVDELELLLARFRKN